MINWLNPIGMKASDMIKQKIKTKNIRANGSVNNVIAMLYLNPHNKFLKMFIFGKT